ncbi:hypothetical protein FRC19_009571, partial [Serendipita sp. 401]
MIIDLIVIPLRHPYLYCEPETFSQYATLLWKVDSPDKLPFLDDWKRVRAVCKVWKHLAGVKPCCFLKEEPCHDAPEPDVPKATSSVFIYSRANGPLAMKRIAHLKENLTTLALGLSTQWIADTLDILLDNPSMFPNLRCLSLWSNRTTRPFWKVIQDEFPNLVSLTVRYDVDGEPGVYVLRNLEILSIYMLDGFQLECPSLKHLHISYTTSVVAHQFIMEHGRQLESFIGELPGSIETKDLWSSIFPNVVTFGCWMHIVHCRVFPPSDHPFRHLRLRADYNSLAPEQVLTEIDAYRFSGLESVQVKMSDMRQGTVNELRAGCRERGIRLTEIDDGTPFIEQQPRKAMDYIRMSFTSCTLLCLFPCL